MLDADTLNPIIDDLRKWALTTRDELLRAFYASGNPPGTERLSDREVYERLISLMRAGHPDYWENPEAQAELERLGRTYGAAPVPVPGGMG
jgi:cytochrome P450